MVLIKGKKHEKVHNSHLKNLEKVYKYVYKNLEKVYNEVIEKLKHLSYFSPIYKHEMSAENILPYGRAYENGLSKQRPDLSELTNYQKNYHITEYEGSTYLVIKYQYISANGNVVNDGCQSYDLMDKYALGNVQRQRIEDIYINGPSRKLIRF